MVDKLSSSNSDTVIDVESLIQSRLSETRQALKLPESELAATAEAAQIWVDALRSGGKIIFCGNGGLAAEAQHFAGELVGRFLFERRALPAVALTADSTILTAIGNDYDFDQIFARQVEAIGQENDVLVGMTTSGESKNISTAFTAAKSIGIKVVAIVGNRGTIGDSADIAIRIPSASTPRIQEATVAVGHILCELAERQMFANTD